MAKRGDEVSTFFFITFYMLMQPHRTTVALSGLCFLYCPLVVKWSVFMGKVKLFLQYTAVETAWRTLEEYLG